MQIVFQDPYSSLNPRMLIKDIVSEPLLMSTVSPSGEELERAGPEPSWSGRSEPRAPVPLLRMSSAVARGRGSASPGRSRSTRTWSCWTSRPPRWTCRAGPDPEHAERPAGRASDLTYLFISHDLSTIRYMCDRVNVMYLGKIVESANKGGAVQPPPASVHRGPALGHTRARPGAETGRILLSGDVPCRPIRPPDAGSTPGAATVRPSARRRSRR